MVRIRLQPGKYSLTLLCAAPLVFFCCSSAWAQTGASLCGASPKIQAALDNIYKQKQAPGETDYAYWHSTMQALKTLAQRYPHNYFVQRAYVTRLIGPDPSTQGWPSERGALQAIAEYKALHKRHPHDAVIAELYATTLIDRDTPAAIKLLEGALQENPSFPWPNMALVRIYTSRNFHDPAKAESHLSAFLSACPENLSAYTWVQGMGIDEFTRKIAPQWRKILAKQLEKRKVSDQAIGEYPALWGLEFRLHPRTDYGALRKQVAADVARIRALKMQKSFAWWYTLGQGYTLMGDSKQVKWAQTGRDKRIPASGPYPGMPEVAKWFKHHPYPKPDATKDKRQAFFREELKQTDLWTKKYPDSRQIWRVRMSAMSELDDVPVAECAATVKKLYQLERANAGPLPIYWWTYIQLADFLSQKQADPALEVELARKGLETIEATWEKMPMYDLRVTKDGNDYWPNFYWPAMKARALLYQAQGYTQLKQVNKAVDALNQAHLQIEALNSDMIADPARRNLHDRNAWYHRYESEYWQRMARLAQLQGHDTDAMAYYQSSLLARFGSDRMPSAGEKDELAARAHKLWVKLGGTQAGWNAWYGQRATAMESKPHMEWQAAGKPLPPFRLTDLHGKTWQLADLKGKVAVLNFWATWCYFCVQEMPRLVKVAEQYKNQPDVVFLSVNVDDNPGLIAPFLKKHKLGFPVLPAYHYASDTLKVNAIPQNWIIAPNGVVCLKGIGYDASAKWQQGVKDAIEKCKSYAAGGATDAAPANRGKANPSF